MLSMRIFYFLLVLQAIHTAMPIRDQKSLTLESISADILSQMDSSIDPCHDFYNFACGRYVKHAQIPSDKLTVGNMEDVDDLVVRELKGLLELPDQPNDTMSSLLAKRYYRSCMNTDALKKLGVSPLMGILKKFGGWPIVEGGKWNESDYDWVLVDNAMYRLVKISGLVKIKVNFDFKNNSRLMIEIDQPERTVRIISEQEALHKRLKRNAFYSHTENETTPISRYGQFILDTAVQLGLISYDHFDHTGAKLHIASGANRIMAENDVLEILDFQTALDKILIDEQRRDYNKIYNPMTLHELQDAYPQIPFTNFLQSVAKNGMLMIENDPINIVVPEYFKRLNQVLKGVSRRTIANFQMWVLTLKLIKYLAPTSQNYYREYFSIPKNHSDRWKDCVDDTRESFVQGVGALYVRNYFPGKAKQDIDQLVKNVRTAARITIENLQWMDKQTKAKAQEKLRSMIQKIGYPDYIFDEPGGMADLQKWFKEDAYLENALVAKSAAVPLSGMSEHTNITNLRELWLAGPAEFVAMYNVIFNDITFAASVLQYPFYSPIAPRFFNYGHIGAIIGHEITHGYDNAGSQFDARGNLVPWWTNETLVEFERRITCFINQYSQIDLLFFDGTSIHVNGDRTVGENIADNGGLKLAYKAYKLASLHQGEEEIKLPGLQNYTNDQLFFLAYAQNWCHIAKTRYLFWLLENSRYPPLNIRASVPLQNNRDFAEVYKCPRGSQMNPVEKCCIW